LPVSPNEYVRDPADTLQVASLRLVSNAQCDNSTGLYQTYALSYRGYILDDMMCARHRKRDSCQGDSGGPLLYRGKQGETGAPAGQACAPSSLALTLPSRPSSLSSPRRPVGITSWGVGCNNAAFPGVYARVSSAYAWIQENVCTLSIYPDQQFRCEPW
jgi:trypsin